MAMEIEHIQIEPFDDQKAGTSGLRKSVQQFKTAHYLAAFVQSIFNTLTKLNGSTLILGGDGRFFNREAIQIILRIAAANGVKKVLVGQSGILSTPAVSHLIRKYQALGGIILSASHNPGGLQGDFGIKFNMSNGGPAVETMTEAFYQESLRLREYKTIPTQAIPLDRLGDYQMADLSVTVIDSVLDYTDLMTSIFDFDKISTLLSSDHFSMRFDAMHAVTGPYATHIFLDCLNAPKTSLMNEVPLSNFGGGHPDPNQAHAKQLMQSLYSTQNIQFGAASDGDGDRNMILGNHFFVTPSDSLAILAANAHLIPAYKKGLNGVARSMPTSQAVDRVAKKLQIPCYETPTGWKFFGNLLEANKITLCGEESFGTGSDHVREKDGLWAVLFWLNLIAEKQDSVENIVRAHWAEYGRNYYSRHDYENINTTAAHDLMDMLQCRLNLLIGQNMHGRIVKVADSFSYQDPIDHAYSKNQGIRLLFEDGARIIFRLSGTGTKGATLRVYFESYETDVNKHDMDTQDALADLIQIANETANIQQLTRRDSADVIT